jgi:hypothetical protein
MAERLSSLNGSVKFEAVKERSDKENFLNELRVIPWSGKRSSEKTFQLQRGKDNKNSAKLT